MAKASALIRFGALAVAAAFAVPAHSQDPWALMRPIGDLSQLRQVPSQTESGYRRLLPSIAKLVSNGAQAGSAVLIDPSGLYLAHLASIHSPEMEARFWNGTLGHLRLISQDNTTQLALLRSDYVPPGAKPIVSPTHELDPGTPLIVILDEGAVKARIESSDKLAIIQPSNRMLPATEIRFETPTGMLSGALVFTEAGEFLGVLNATLGARQQQEVAKGQVLQNFAGGAGGAIGGGVGGFAAPRGAMPLQSRGGDLRLLGPADLTVAYTPGVDVMRRVFEGFLSPSRTVEHPSIGIKCLQGVTGALVIAVLPGSPAQKAGLMPSDMIVGMGEMKIRNQIDYAKVLFSHKPGDKVPLRIDRGGRTLQRTVVIGKSTD